MSRTLAIITIALLSIFAVVPAPSPSATPAVVDPVTWLESMVNTARQDQGLPPLKHNDGLSKVAQEWSESMAASGNMAHNTQAESKIPQGWSSWAENVGYASGQTNNAKQIFDAWMASPDHKANILSPDFTDMGIGVTVDKSGVMWATQDFAQYPTGASSQPEKPNETTSEPVTNEVPSSEVDTSDVAPVVETPPAPALPVVVDAQEPAEPSPSVTPSQMPTPTPKTASPQETVTPDNDHSQQSSPWWEDWRVWVLAFVALASGIGAVMVYLNDKKKPSKKPESLPRQGDQTDTTNESLDLERKDDHA